MEKYNGTMEKNLVLWNNAFNYGTLIYYGKIMILWK